MFGSWSLAVYLAIGVVLLSAGTLAYVHWKDSIKQQVYIEQERKLDAIKEKTNAAKDGALNSADPRGELHKYARPD